MTISWKKEKVNESLTVDCIPVITSFLWKCHWMALKYSSST